MLGYQTQVIPYPAIANRVRQSRQITKNRTKGAKAMYQNVGTKSAGQDIPTKKALKEAIAANPANVTLYSTDAFGANVGKTWKADKLDNGVKYSVTGPNPYTSRKWYATVEKTPNGKVTVK